MTFGHRRLSRAVGATLLILAGMAVPADPAEAAKRGPDLAVDASGTRLALGVARKVAYLKISNLGDETPSGATINVRQPPGDPMAIALLWHSGGSGECDGDVGGFYCELPPELIPGPGETVDIPIDALIQISEGPYEGRFEASVRIESGKDANPANNTKWFPLELVDQPSVDLSLVARDVKQSVRIGRDGTPEPTGTLNPGETGALRYAIANQGRKAVSGVKATLHLPRGVAFTRPPAECVLADAGQSAVCTYEELTLVPTDEDTDPNDTIYSAVELYNLVTTPTSATAPATFRGGAVQVEGLAERSTVVRSEPARTALPANAIAVSAAEVDHSDNRDGFAVVLTAKRGDGGGGDGGRGGDGDGGLPVTGPQAGLIGGVGLAVLAAGGMLFLVARRRRIILVTSEVETPAA